MRKIDESSRSKSEREEKSRDDLPSTYARLTFRSRYSWSSGARRFAPAKVATFTCVDFSEGLSLSLSLVAPAQVIATDPVGHRL